MKISTNQFFDSASQLLVNSQQRLAQVQSQLATGKKINNASDSPSDATNLQRLRTLVSQQESYQKNLGSLQDRLSNQDTTLRSASNILIRIKELSIQAASATLNADQRKSIGIEVKGLRDQLLSLANAKDTNGYGLFAGGKVKGDAFGPDANGDIQYLGDENSNQIPVGDTRVISNRRTGLTVFSPIARIDASGNSQSVGFFQTLDDLTSALQSNDASGVRNSLDELDQLHASVTTAQADVGSDMTIVESQGKVLDEQVVRLKALQSQSQDLDYNEAVTRMQKEMLSLQAAQSSFAQIAKMSLFNYVN